MKEGSSVAFFMLPRGLASAVLATLPMSMNIKGCEAFVTYTFGVIVLYNLLVTVGAFHHGRKNRDNTDAAIPEFSSIPKE